MFSSIGDLTRRLRREQDALVQVDDQARQVGDGTDDSGSITVLLDEEGIARDVVVASDWRRRLAPAHLGAAVVAADDQAARRRALATAQALARVRLSNQDGQLDVDDGLSAHGASSPTSKAPRSTDGVAGLHAGGSTWLVPVPPVGDATEGRPRPLAELFAAVLAASEDLDRMTAGPPPVEGTGAGGAVSITLAHGRIVACTVSQGWLAHQDDVTLAHALREAISAAATARRAAGRPLIEYQQRLAGILADTQATLRSLGPGAGR